MNRRSFLLAAPGVPLALRGSPVAAAVEGRAPERDEVTLAIFQYATGEHPVPIAWAYNPPDGHVHTAPVLQLAVRRPFEARIEPRWTGGKTPLDLIFEVKVDSDIHPVDMDDIDGDGFSNAWTQLTHLGPQTKNREMAQIGQHLTMGRGPLLHPMPDRPLGVHVRVDYQLGKQNAPKLVGEGRILVLRDA